MGVLGNGESLKTCGESPSVLITAELNFSFLFGGVDLAQNMRRAYLDVRDRSKVPL